MRFTRIVLSTVVGVSLAGNASADVVTFTDLDAFLEAAGDVQEIDFETLPDGTPSVRFTPITLEFNYTDQGVTFSSPLPTLQINMLGGGDFYLTTLTDTGLRNWIIADFVTPACAVGIIFPGGTTLSGFDGDGQLIASVSGGGSGGGHFLGIVSDVPIVTATGDRGSSGDAWQSFFFAPVPEPGTFLLVGAGAVALLRRRRSSRSVGLQNATPARRRHWSTAYPARHLKEL
ncbi:MAG: PEP-CTERM sorting domain-containing protein [Phycisphaerae bacterium]